MHGLKGALSVRIDDGTTDRIVTSRCRDLKFTKVAPGGHQAMSFTMVVPHNTFADLGPEDRVWLCDARTGRTIFDAYLSNPTPVDGPAGQQYAISAMGGMTLANDESRALVYADRDLRHFFKGPDSATSGNVETGDWPTDPAQQRVRTQFANGSVADTGAIAAAWNDLLRRAGMGLGGIRIGNCISGKSDAGYRQEFTTDIGDIESGEMTDIGGVYHGFVGDDFDPCDLFSLRTRRTGAATNVVDDLTYTDWVDYSVIGQRMNRHGALLTGAAGLVSATQVTASQIAEDLLGRVLTFCDPASARIDATTFGITQLAYPDGIKAAGVLNDIGVFEPDMLWEILETLPNGRHRFNYRAWPTTARYEVSTKDGWRQTGSDVDLCNRILVSWTDYAGQTQVTPVTAEDLGLVGIGLPVDELAEQGRVKDADPITLPDGKGSKENALRVGEQILRDKINPPHAGTVLIRRPILDYLTGNRVMPWELEPGYPCRVRELGEDLPITQVDYDDDGCSSLLTLGRPVLTDEQRLAKLDRAVPTVLVGI